MAMLKSCLLLFIIFSMGNTEVNVTRNVNRLGAVGLSRRCPATWIKLALRCYKFISDPSNWITAERNCQSLGANLASVRNNLENKFLLSLLPSSSTRAWVGGHDAVQEGQWLWSDGTVFSYTNWWTGEPNNAGFPDNHQGAENCLEINYSSDRCWNDVPCSASFPYICVKDL
ncbi:ladderlectin-like isoform X3 [Rhinichthys klamathensis goyatoka]|uniref:ladderlectin-like isoform X3 n=1 Tax=Rhinichthys klamathensis goyatoka TaxID=3034132 RepID=UPI0024B5C7CE|nr:ladderlectin-like isoform X3 [Rhinichthys klamathensis goyatoka]